MSLNELQEAIKTCEQNKEYQKMLTLRAQIARDYPGTQEAAEALYRIGLYFLFIEQRFDAAKQTFEQVLTIADNVWVHAARVSFATLLLREDKPQKALLELRKVTQSAPSVHTISAFSVMELIYEQHKQAGEIQGIKEQKIKHYQIMIQDLKQHQPVQDPALLAYYLVHCGFEQQALLLYQDAHACFKEVLALGESKVPADLYKQAQKALLA